jgi:hypothetical protein
MSERLYVDLFETPRVIVRKLFPEGETLAAIMTDSWLKDEFSTTNRKWDDLDPEMLKLHGITEWPALRARAVKAYWEARDKITDALRTGNVMGKGTLIGAAYPHAIDGEEWSRRVIDFKHNLLATPPGKSFSSCPEIRDVSVCVEILLRECAPQKTPDKVEHAEPEKNKGGAPTVADWPPIKEQVKDEIRLVGFPKRTNEPGWQYQADVARFIGDRTGGVETASSTLKAYARRWLKEIRSELEAEKTARKSET